MVIGLAAITMATSCPMDAQRECGYNFSQYFNRFNCTICPTHLMCFQTQHAVHLQKAIIAVQKRIQCAVNGTCCPSDHQCIPGGCKKNEQVGVIYCDDGIHYCYDGYTCCKGAYPGTYNCCPYPQASCCADGIHCCPHNMICDVRTMRCLGDNRISKAVKNIQAEKESDLIERIVGRSLSSSIEMECGSEDKLCEINGEKGCCPHKDGVCCSSTKCCPKNHVCIKEGNDYSCCFASASKKCHDNEHCCPEEMECDVEKESCKLGKFDIPWFNNLKSSSIETKSNVLSVNSSDQVCPDKSQCPGDSTCCLMDDGTYGCCPYREATCCEDKEHCCPNGYSCDLVHQQCQKNGLSAPLLKKLPSIKYSDQVCPDKSQCPGDWTCCLMNDGTYWCCPFREATCCEDKRPRTVPVVPTAIAAITNNVRRMDSQLPCLRSCPALNIQTSCDLVHQQCQKNGLSAPLLKKLPSLNFSDQICPDKSQCPGDSTCCLMKDGTYGCCPYREATCCEDKESCCPNGYSCDLVHQQCQKNGLSAPLLKKLPSLNFSDQICPDKSQCPGDSTCCLMKDGTYGCCPYREATCCEDKESCCPNGYSCDLVHQQCQKNGLSAPLLKKLPSLNSSDQICPDKSQCPGDSTCCLIDDHGTYGCCPYREATCCEDKEHCCPNGYSCDLVHKKCQKNGLSAPLLKKLPSLNSSDQICPDKSQCPGDSTCCLMKDGTYGCCPYREATCCEDKESCCPNGYSCDLVHQQCQKNGLSAPLLKKLPSLNSSDQICPDKSQCPEDSTCCLIDDHGTYGCCPYREATCCEDKEHCCPNGYSCDLVHKKCQKNGLSAPLLKKLPSLNSSDQICPDKSQCPGDSTCCLMKDGTYGCCPYREATCCEDKESCCPNGYSCDLVHQQCQKNGLSAPLLKKLPSIKYSDQVCPDKSQCPEDSTCCLMKDGTYGCCPYREATCCEDKESCCPNGYSCDLVHKKCQKNGLSAPLLKKLPSLNSSDQICPDKSQCPGDSTCCLMKDGTYGCCPYREATCCEDKESCCPNGYSCDLVHQQCQKNGLSAPLLKKLPSLNSSDQICPDKSQCPGDSTCCLLKDGTYGCCPYREATCCEDKEHCCPNGYSCDLVHKKCQKNGLSAPLLKKLPSLNSSDQICPDKSQCPGDSTCCLMKDGTYACCPYREATCCEDKESCCPNGYSCDLVHQQCQKNGLSAPLLKKLPSLNSSDQICPDKSQCPGDSTCCLMDDGTYGCCPYLCPDKTECPGNTTCCLMIIGGYGCCPYREATCCKDKISCCPNGYSCDIVRHLCQKNGLSAPLLKKLPSLNSSDQICPDKSQCPGDSTCCLLKDGTYGCCPYREATCCEEKEHCCPNGYSCDLVHQQCQKNGLSAPLLKKLPSIKSSDQVCPDKSQCPGDSTCCLMDDGTYGCCPYREATCCEDKESCCPNGYSCDLVHQQCQKNGLSAPLLKKLPSLNSSDQICPDKSQCPGDSTCCLMDDGTYGCCPYREATCCEDKEHCCPNGYSCDLVNKKCRKEGITLPFEKNIIPSSNEVICPDLGYCSDGSTCCSMKNGSYGCCPLQNAVCCADQKHCCPNGYKCGPLGIYSTNYQICPDRSKCPEDSTCCLMEDGSYGCCLYSEATCCSDGVHCCPNGYSCDLVNQDCQKNGLSAPLLKKLPSMKSSDQVCPDKSQCPGDSTCCLMDDGTYGCCPYREATCCEDKEHCCPNGYSCDLVNQDCRKNELSAPLLKKLPIKNQKGVICPDDTICPKNTTCCKMITGPYGCCPFPNATCCRDGIHCCPHGNRCDMVFYHCISE
ncbi:GRN, partial [Cordylochernes scorpioides]